MKHTNITEYKHMCIKKEKEEWLQDQTTKIWFTKEPTMRQTDRSVCNIR